jgi:hypothetical protein
VNGEPGDEQPLLYRYGGPAGTLPVVSVHLTVVDSTQIVPGILRPDLPTTIIAAQWAAALNLSRGGGVLVQLATRGDDQAELRGPCELTTPEVDDALDEAITDDAIGGLLLGQDFLQSVVVSLLGPARLVVILSPPEE